MCYTDIHLERTGWKINYTDRTPELNKISSGLIQMLQVLIRVRCLYAFSHFQAILTKADGLVCHTLNVLSSSIYSKKSSACLHSWTATTLSITVLALRLYLSIHSGLLPFHDPDTIYSLSTLTLYFPLWKSHLVLETSLLTILY